MKKELFLTVDQAKHLQKLGLDMSDSLLCYLLLDTDTPEQYGRIFFTQDLCKTDKFIPTYTLQEILDKLPCGVTWDTWQVQITLGLGGDEMEYNDGDGYSPHREVDENLFDNLLNKAYKMLCWVLVNKLLKEEKK